MFYSKEKAWSVENWREGDVLWQCHLGYYVTVLLKKKIIAEHLFLYTEGEAALQVNNFELRRL